MVTQQTGLGLFVAGLIGYGAGLFIQYPGRAFSATAVMIGITLFAIGHRTPDDSP